MGINLAWDDCGAAGAVNKSFACDVDSGLAFDLIASFSPPPNIDQFVGISSELTLVSSNGILPDWWNIGDSRCRQASAITDGKMADFRDGPFTCGDAFTGQAAGWFDYDIAYGGPDRARLRVGAAVPLEDLRSLTTGREYYAFRLSISPRGSTDISNCGGCEVPMILTLDNIQLYQHPEAGNDPLLVQPLDRSVVSWQNAQRPPHITSFAPLEGGEGTIVVIHGFDLMAARSVQFGRLEASFTVVSDAEIDATAPAGVRTSRIVVTTPAGSATSSGVFVVVGSTRVGLNLSWDDCGSAGAEFKTFACNTNEGPAFDLIGSFMPPPHVDELVGLYGAITIVSSVGILPDWWKLTCRGGSAISAQFNFTAGPFTCEDFYVGQAAGGYAYDIGFGGVDRARLRIQAAVPFENRAPVYPDVEYYAFRIPISRIRTAGATACFGCVMPVTLTFDYLRLFQPPEIYDDPIITEPLDRNVVTWQKRPQVAPPGNLTLSAVSWDPQAHGIRAVFSLARSASATFWVYDLAGRSLARYPLEGLSRGPNVVTIPASSMQSGVFFARLTQGDRHAIRKFTITR